MNINSNNQGQINFLNTAFGIIGRTVSTKNEPNTSSEFNFWVHDHQDLLGRIEIGNIVAAQSDSDEDITFGVVTEMRAYSDVDSFIADYLSHDFGSADLTVPTDISNVTVVTCAVMRNLSSKTKPVARSRVYFPSREGIQFAYGIINAEGKSILRLFLWDCLKTEIQPRLLSVWTKISW